MGDARNHHQGADRRFAVPTEEERAAFGARDRRAYQEHPEGPDDDWLSDLQWSVSDG